VTVTARPGDDETVTGKIGVFRGWTYLGSPVGLVASLRPGTTFRLAAQGRDNCTGATSPLSEPLRVTTLR
jgi:hypothetical protein